MSSKGSEEEGSKSSSKEKEPEKGCKENILEKYPDAECFKSKDKNECRNKCEEKVSYLSP